LEDKYDSSPNLGSLLVIPIMHPDIRITSSSQISSNEIPGFNYYKLNPAGFNFTA
jgi:hypothetical protein